MRVDAREKGAAERAAERVPRDCVGKVDAARGQAIDCWRVHVRIAVASKRLSPVLVAEYPDNVLEITHESRPRIICLLLGYH